jgi:uncharacterized protein (TIGR03083 family)
MDVRTLFAPLHGELIALLRRLPDDAWQRPTLAPAWSVRDVAAHLLDGDLRKLSAHRDGHLLPMDAPDVLTLINALNASGVAYAARLSPRLLTDLLEVSGRWVTELVESLDPDGQALFPVAWAGEAESRNWMDTGREYTERWHHQMQIRDAAGEPLLLDDRWFVPLLWFSLHALPPRIGDAALNIDVDGLRWSIANRAVHEGFAPDANATLHMDRDTAWRMLYNAPFRGVRIEGDEALARRALTARSVMV